MRLKKPLSPNCPPYATYTCTVSPVEAEYVADDRVFAGIDTGITEATITYLTGPYIIIGLHIICMRT